jgi:hypothetical protein
MTANILFFLCSIRLWRFRRPASCSGPVMLLREDDLAKQKRGVFRRAEAPDLYGAAAAFVKLLRFVRLTSRRCGGSFCRRR